VVAYENKNATHLAKNIVKYEKKTASPPKKKLKIEDQASTADNHPVI
jgi:hypothetical protein